MVSENLAVKIVNAQNSEEIIQILETDQDERYIRSRPSRFRTGVRDVDILSPSTGRTKIRIRNTANKIVTKPLKRLELEHIDNVIKNSQGGIPDFGFNPEIFTSEFNGWDRIVDMINELNKYERIKNYIDAKAYLKAKRDFNESKFKSKLQHKQTL